MKRHPDDFALQDLMDRLCPACSVPVDHLVDPEIFTAQPDYRGPDGAPFWQAATIKAWVQLHVLGELLAHPLRFAQVADLIQSVRRLAAAEPLTPEALRDQVIQNVVESRWAQIGQGVRQ